MKQLGAKSPTASRQARPNQTNVSGRFHFSFLIFSFSFAIGRSFEMAQAPWSASERRDRKVLNSKGR